MTGIGPFLSAIIAIIHRQKTIVNKKGTGPPEKGLARPAAMVAA